MPNTHNPIRRNAQHWPAAALPYCTIVTIGLAASCAVERVEGNQALNENAASSGQTDINFFPTSSAEHRAYNDLFTWTISSMLDALPTPEVATGLPVSAALPVGCKPPLATLLNTYLLEDIDTTRFAQLSADADVPLQLFTHAPNEHNASWGVRPDFLKSMLYDPFYAQGIVARQLYRAHLKRCRIQEKQHLLATQINTWAAVAQMTYYGSAKPRSSRNHSAHPAVNDALFAIHSAQERAPEPEDLVSELTPFLHTFNHRYWGFDSSLTEHLDPQIVRFLLNPSIDTANAFYEVATETTKYVEQFINTLRSRLAAFNAQHRGQALSEDLRDAAKLLSRSVKTLLDARRLYIDTLKNSQVWQQLYVKKPVENRYWEIPVITLGTTFDTFLRDAAELGYGWLNKDNRIAGDAYTPNTYPLEHFEQRFLTAADSQNYLEQTLSRLLALAPEHVRANTQANLRPRWCPENPNVLSTAKPILNASESIEEITQLSATIQLLDTGEEGQIARMELSHLRSTDPGHDTLALCPLIVESMRCALSHGVNRLQVRTTIRDWDLRAQLDINYGDMVGLPNMVEILAEYDANTGLFCQDFGAEPQPEILEGPGSASASEAYEGSPYFLYWLPPQKP